MKKTIALVLALTMVFALVACGTPANTPNTPDAGKDAAAAIKLGCTGPLTGDAAMLYTKSVLDFILVMIFASTMGVGVLFSAVPLFLYQGGITLFAGVLAPLLGAAVISDLSLVGNVLIFGVGVNVAFGKQLAVGNMLPALVVPVVYHLFI